MSQVKLSKLVINKFANLKYAELSFDKFTLVTGKLQAAAALPSAVEAIKFIGRSSDIPDDLRQFKDTSGEVDDGSLTYVEAFIILPDGREEIFKKTIKHTVSQFYVADVLVSPDEYQIELVKSGFVLAVPDTFVLNAKHTDKVATLTDIRRAAFIEVVTGNDEITQTYDSLSKKIEEVRVEYDATAKKKTELTVEKKKLKSDIDAANDRDQLRKDQQAEETQLDLFKLFHNNSLIESLDDEVNVLKECLNEATEKVLESVGLPQEDIEIENELKLKMSNLEKVMRDRIQDLMGVQEEYFKEKTKENSMTALKNVHQKAIAMNRERAAKLSVEINALQHQLDTKREILMGDKEYNKLQQEFEQENMEQFTNIFSLRLIIREDYLNYLKRNLEEHLQSAAGNLQDQQELEEMEAKRLQMIKESIEYEKEVAELKMVEDTVSVLDIKIERSEAKKKQVKVQRKVLNDLKRVFHQKIIGRLSELWTPVKAADKHLLKESMGKFVDAIVVDTKDSAEECIEYLKIKQMITIDEVFLPLSEVVNQKSTKDLLTRGKLPAGVECQAIENLFNANSEDIEKAVLFAVKPSLVVDSLDDAEKLTNCSVTKRLNIVANQGGLVFQPRGCISVLGSEQEDETVDLYEGRKKAVIEMLKKKHSLEQKGLDFEVLKKELAKLVFNIEQLKESLLPSKRELIKAEEFREKISAIEKATVEQRQLLNKALADIQQKQAVFFHAFCQKVNSPSIEQYSRLRKEVLMFSKGDYRMKQRQAEECSNKIKNHKAQLKQYAQDSQSAETERKIQILKSMLTEDCKEYLELYRKLHKLQQEIRKKEEYHEELIQKAFDANEKIYDKLNQVQMALKENFETLTRSFMEHRSVAYEERSLEDFAIAPDEVTDNYLVVQEQLNNVHIDFNRLKKSLKENVDVVKKSQELTQKLEKLRSKIEDTGGKIKYEANDQRLKRIGEELTAVSKVLASQKTRLDAIGTELQEIKQIRKQSFVESIKIINEGMSEFCRMAFDEHIIASLEISNESEPYLGDVIFYWRTIENTENRVNEISRNYVAALAFLFAVLRQKQQKFVVLDDVTRNVSFDLRQFFERQTWFQAVSLSSRMSEEHVNYVVRPKGSSFYFKKID